MSLPANAPTHPVTRGYRIRLRIMHAIIAALATLGGAVMGFIVTLALVVFEARQGKYIFGLDDLAAFRWDVLPIPLLAVAGFLLGRRRPHSVSWATVCGLAGLIVGLLFGAWVGPLLWGQGVGQWAGGVIGGAIGLVAGTVASLRIKRVHRNPLVVGTALALVFLGIFSFAVFGATNLLDLDPLDLPETASVPMPEASQVDAVVFLLGDAGAGEQGRSPLLVVMKTAVEQWTTALHRDSAVTVVFVGDNVYPQGVHNRDDPSFPTDSARLWSQIDLVDGPEAKKQATLGLFVTGNHDWGNTTGQAGFVRILNQETQLQAARTGGRFVALLPAAGDPGPVFRDLRRNVRLAFYDTHMFLQERSAEERSNFFARLKQILDDARDREVILVAHHPYYSAGPHGAIIPGYHTLGVAYVLKQAGALVQDLNSPPYHELLAGLRRTFDASRKPPLIYAGGHDHSLQVLTGAGEFDPRFVLVSGAGSKVSSIQMGPGLVWGGSQPGYMMLVFRKDDGVDLFVYGGDKAYLKCAGADDAIARCMNEGVNSYQVIYSASLLGPSKQPRELTPVVPDTIDPGTPWWTEGDTVPVATGGERPTTGDRVAPVAVPAGALLPGADSVTTTTGRSYPAGRIRRIFAGDLNRHLWSVPIRLPVLDLATVGGGLHVKALSGGSQTLGLRFSGRDGLEYEFRPAVKNAASVLPQWMREGLVGDIVDDQMAAQFPLGATVVARLQDAARIEAPQPVAVVMPNDPRLGQYRSIFAGRVGLLSVHANEREEDRPGFGGYTRIVETNAVYEDLRNNPGSTFDDRYFLRIRLIDMLVGDWDRHAGQWRWARKGTQWRAIPEDRDWAFSRIDGTVGVLARGLMPRYVGFSEKLPRVSRLAQAGSQIDHRVLNRLDREDFIAAAREIQSALTDSVIDAAVRVLPHAYVALERNRLGEALRARRRQLAEYAEDYYRHLARTLHVYGFANSLDQVEFEQIGDNSVRIRLRTGGSNGPVRFERVINARDTREVKLFIDNDRDQVVGNKDLPFKVSLAVEPAEED